MIRPGRRIEPVGRASPTRGRYGDIHAFQPEAEGVPTVTLVWAMSVRLSDDEAWIVMAESHTGILSSLRRDGVPVSLPVWFITDGRAVLVAGPKASHKFARIRRDPRVSFLVESGESWRELRAVHLIGTADIIQSPDWASLDSSFDDKYREFRTPRAEMPTSASERYERGRSIVRITATEPLITWDNRRLEAR